MTWTTYSDGDAVTSTNILDDFIEVYPIGSIIAWAKSMTGVPALSDRFLECDGSVISDADSPLDGETLPDLLDPQSFLRGNTTSGGTGGSDTHDHDFSGTTGGSGYYTTLTGPIGVARGNHTHNYSGTTETASSLPVYFEVVWVMRIK